MVFQMVKQVHNTSGNRWDGLEVIEATQYGAGTSSFGKFSGAPQSSRFGVHTDALFERSTHCVVVSFEDTDVNDVTS